MPQDVIAQQPTGFVAGQHAPAVVDGDTDRAAVGVGVERHRDVGIDACCKIKQRVHRARLLGIRERDGGEVGVGRELTWHRVYIGEPGPPQRLDRGGAADAVQRGQRHPHRPRTSAHRGGALQVALENVVTTGCHWRAADFVGIGRRSDRGFDLTVGGRDDLQTAVEVHLVAVVRRRVV